MKTLYIVRHAKSSWDDAGLIDVERPLLEKGREKTRRVCEYLVEKKVSVDKIICSHALRAFETAKILAEALKYPASQVEVSEDVYMCDAYDMTELVMHLPDDIDSVMIVGHNPDMTDFANQFLDKEIIDLPTSGVVCIEFRTDSWVEIIDARKKTKFLITPKILS
jgi:phosphohistidine phosphatase